MLVPNEEKKMKSWGKRNFAAGVGLVFLQKKCWTGVRA
jgi:hypothetical protein